MTKPVREAPHLNPVTTPIEDKPDYTKTGIIKAVWKGQKIPVGKITYEHFGNEEFQYCIEPYWDIIDSLHEREPKAFVGIPGIDMDCRYRKYYRVNHTPSFVKQRTPPKNRVDVMDLMEAVGLNYYDPFEWLLRTNMKASQDNLIVEPE